MIIFGPGRNQEEISQFFERKKKKHTKTKNICIN